ncbi:MAG: hypothetical protein IKX88_00750 [Thermoguttaceae bacterium]|nr:hypothetical protein [Thermoguttaceae bacterium]
MKRKLSLFFAIISALSFATFADAETIIPAVPDSEAVYPDFEVRIDGVEAPVWQCRVSAIPFNRVWPGYQRGLDQTELAGFVTWETDAPTTEIVVRTTRDADALKSVVVRPLSLGIRPKIDAEKKEIAFTIPGTTPTVLELGDFHNCLHLLPFPIYKRPDNLNAPNLRYFGPGVHHEGLIEVKSGDEIFVDAGAVVYGGVRGRDVENVKISGPGIIDAGPYERGTINGIFRFINSKNVQIDGIVQRDPDVWSTTLLHCDDVAIRNTKLVGLWRYNADGIDVCNSERVLVENSFLRTFDDSLVVKGLEKGTEGPQKPCKDLTFRNNVVWCDWGRALELGAETCAPEFRNIRFENIDVIRATHIAMDIQHGDRAKIRDVTFENIRVEFDDKIPAPIYQSSDDQVYNPDADPGFCPNLAVIVIASGMWSQDTINGDVDGVLFKDVRVYGARKPYSSFTGKDAEHKATNVVFDNLQINGEKIMSAEAMNLVQNEFVEGVSFR